jgi:amino acid transporter
VNARGAVAPRHGFRRHSLTAGSLFFFSVGASAPMTVLVGGIIGAFAVTGVIEVPAAFLLLTVALLLASVGYAWMGRYIHHAGPLYAHVARGLGPTQGVGAAVVAQLAYNGIHLCLYFLFGVTMEGFQLGPWWVWALLAWLFVAVLGPFQVTWSALVLRVALGAELVVVCAFVVFALLNPATGHLDPAPMWPGHLLGSASVGGVLALAAASFTGYETTLAYGEEAVHHRAQTRALYGSLIFLGLFYTLAGWAVTMATGPNNVAQASATRSQGIVFDVLQTHFGALGLSLGRIFLATSIAAALLSFHQTIARYLFVMTREDLITWRWLGRVGKRSGAPIGGSLAQSTLGLSVIMVCAVLGFDPLGVFFWLAALAAVGIMSLLAVSSLAAWMFFNRRNGGPGNLPVRLKVVPLLGAAAMAGMTALTVNNLHSMTNMPQGAWQVWILPALIGAGYLAGLVWGAVVKVRRRDIARRIGHGEREPLAVLGHHLLPEGVRL